jgi:hypothetical protein
MLLRSFWLLALTLSTASCADRSSAEDPLRAALSQVPLPDGALPFHRYARYYAKTGRTTVAVVLIVHDLSIRKLVAEECAREGIKGYPCDTPTFGKLGPGEWIWVQRNQLPAMSGGGCTKIRIDYDRVAMKPLRVECNGSY